jgi:hypothetical protein
MEGFGDLQALSDLLNAGAKEEIDPFANTGQIGRPADPSSSSALTPSTIANAQPKPAPVPAPVVKAKDPDAIWSPEEVDEAEDALEDFSGDHRARPEHEVLYKQRIGAEDVYLGLGGKNNSSMGCDELVVKFKLPGTEFKDITLDSARTSVTVKTPKFAIALPLPRRVDPQNGSAKWEKDREVLVVTLPIDHSDGLGMIP